MRHVAAVGFAILLAGVGVSPSLGQWVEAPGTGWAQLQIAHGETTTIETTPATTSSRHRRCRPPPDSC